MCCSCSDQTRPVHQKYGTASPRCSCVWLCVPYLLCLSIPLRVVGTAASATGATPAAPARGEVILTPVQAQSASNRLPPGYVYAPAGGAPKGDLLPAKRVRKPVQKLDMSSPELTTSRNTGKGRRSGGGSKARPVKRVHALHAASVAPVAPLTADALASASALKDELAKTEEDLLLIAQLEAGNLPMALTHASPRLGASASPIGAAAVTPFTAPAQRKRVATSQVGVGGVCVVVVCTWLFVYVFYCTCV
jgi:hypothetical protein